MRTSQALKAGIHPRTLYGMRDAGLLERVSRGLYRLTDVSLITNPDLVSVAVKIPEAVVCLISALAHHEITTQIPHRVDIALPRTARTPRISYPPIRVYRFSGKSMTEGIEIHEIDRAPVRIFCAEKTIADCFKFRNKVGLDVAVEALRTYWRKPKRRSSDIWHFATIDRVQNVMRPYLETLM